MCGFVLSGDLFNLFVFFELMTVSAFALVGFQVRSRGAPAGRDRLRRHERGRLASS